MHNLMHLLEVLASNTVLNKRASVHVLLLTGAWGITGSHCNAICEIVNFEKIVKKARIYGALAHFQNSSFGVILMVVK